MLPRFAQPTPPSTPPAPTTTTSAATTNVKAWLPVLQKPQRWWHRPTEIYRSARVMVALVMGVPLALLGLFPLVGVAAWLGFPLALRGYRFTFFGTLFFAYALYLLFAAGYALWIEKQQGRRAQPLATNSAAPLPRRANPVLSIAGPTQAPLNPWRASAQARFPEPNSRYEEGWRSAFEFRRIGIVLAGGGAKGVYQAGALQAIHDFLSEHKALDAVISLAATSIGSWNALFWLSEMLRHAPGEASCAERWWKEYRLAHLVRPARLCVPGLTPALFTPDPWREEFDRLFGRHAAPGYDALNHALAALPLHNPLHFYLTRTNVQSGRLCFDTNNRNVTRNPKATHDIDQGRHVTSLQALKDGVLASMSIPPLFHYARIADSQRVEWTEDGGVVDNLPIRLAGAFDGCDLLFVLPLNSSFYKADRPVSLASRLFRVLDVRQGVLERNALKGIYQFNINYALTGERNPVPAFVICPQQPLKIGTTDLWRAPSLRAAVFDQMREATQQALQDFFRPEHLQQFFQAHQAKRDGGALDPAGYIELLGVDPHWVPGNQLLRDTRF